jgi:putative tricarboxylic transport membrane protein
MKNRGFVAVGAGVLALAALMAIGATQIGGTAGYAGAAPDFLPWVVSAVMGLLGVALVVGALRAEGDWVEAPEFPPRWRSMAWVSLGLLLNAALIEYVGFIVSCALLFALAARGFRIGEEQTPTLSMGARDFFIGAAISAPVFWMFTKLLGVNLPSIVRGGWI